MDQKGKERKGRENTNQRQFNSEANELKLQRPSTAGKCWVLNSALGGRKARL